MKAGKICLISLAIVAIGGCSQKTEFEIYQANVDRVMSPWERTVARFSLRVYRTRDRDKFMSVEQKRSRRLDSITLQNNDLLPELRRTLSDLKRITPADDFEEIHAELVNAVDQQINTLENRLQNLDSPYDPGGEVSNSSMAARVALRKIIY